VNEALDALFDPQEPEAVVAVEPAPEPQPEAQAEPVVQAPEPEVKPEPVPQQEHSVPLAKYLDTRDELKEIKRWKAEQEAAKPQAQRPDPLDDPEGFASDLDQRMAARESALVFKVSDRLARKEHGAEAVDTATQWAAEKAGRDPVFAASYMREEDPIDWIVRQHKRDSLLSELGDDPVAYARKIAEREGWLSAPAAAETLVPAAQQAPKPAVPPRSLVSTPAAAGVNHVPAGLAAGMEAIFKS
jgi:hypothetical protein